jgi:hypothetical protein
MSKSDDNEQKQRLERALSAYQQSVCNAIDDLVGAIERVPETQHGNTPQPLLQPAVTLPQHVSKSEETDQHEQRVWWLGGLLMLLIIVMIWTRIYHSQDTVTPISPPKVLANQHQSAPSRS